MGISGWLVDGHPVSTRPGHQLGADGWRFGLGYWEVIWKVPLGSLRVSRVLEFRTDHLMLWYKKKD